MINSFKAVCGLTRRGATSNWATYNCAAFLTKKYVNYFASKTIPLPFLADSINEGTIAEFLKSNLLSNSEQGQWVDQDETVANIETDKVTVQIKSPNAGLITKLHVKQGENLNVGKPLFDIDTDAAKPAGSGTPKPAEQK